MDNLFLKCPIRGSVKAKSKSKDGLTPLEEHYRVEAIKYLIGLGYPKENFLIEAIVARIGNEGRNSLRADFAVLDAAISSIKSKSTDEILKHSIILCEVKRDSSNKSKTVETQVKPLLGFAKRENCLALYWDNIDRRVYWNERIKGVIATRNGPIAFLPRYGENIKIAPLAFKDLKIPDDLLDMFDRVEDLLHSASIDPEQRFSIILQLLLAKLYDEHSHYAHKDGRLTFQDFKAMGCDADHALKTLNALIGKASGHYQKFLPKAIGGALPEEMRGDVVLKTCEIIAPFQLTAAKREVVQAFYMKFAKDLYKWDMAQFFTPPPVTDFIVSVINPRFGEHIKDPACGSADFLTAAFHKMRDTAPNYAHCVWGSDKSKNAVQVAVLNMLLNGDGKSNIKEEDSLANIESESNKYDIVICNPPFGVKIAVSDKKILQKYEMGHEWLNEGGNFIKKKKLLPKQESGILFVEACVRSLKSRGRLAIILPNGYLGNRSHKYILLRHWMLRHMRIASVCSFPRFTFKTSGADVSASVLFMEKRIDATPKVEDDCDYEISFQLIENVGWNLGDKKALPRYKRDEKDGSFIIGDDGKRIIDSDFSGIVYDIRHSRSLQDFDWLSEDVETCDFTGWSVPAAKVVSDATLTLDAKRHSKKYTDLVNAVKDRRFVKMGDIVNIIPEKRTCSGSPAKIIDDKKYNYVEIADIGRGYYSTTSLYGWELPSRARHFAEKGDIFIGAIWGSVSKWCIIPNNAENIVVTNGCHRIHVKPGKMNFLPDLLAFICTEAFCVMMRACARGSDGLAEVSEDDLLEIPVPELSNAQRSSLEPFVDRMLLGEQSIDDKISQLMASGSLEIPIPQKRPSHVVLV